MPPFSCGGKEMSLRTVTGNGPIFHFWVTYESVRRVGGITNDKQKRKH
jgi:hypothetical protein